MQNPRYKKISKSELIPLGDGKNPPPKKIKPQYKQQPGNSRKCIECGKIHDTIVEDIRTGERVSEIDKCKDCLFLKVEIDQKFELEELERPKMPECIKKWANDYLEANGVDDGES